MPTVGRYWWAGVSPTREYRVDGNSFSCFHGGHDKGVQFAPGGLLGVMGREVRRWVRRGANLRIRAGSVGVISWDVFCFSNIRGITGAVVLLAQTKRILIARSAIVSSLTAARKPISTAICRRPTFCDVLREFYMSMESPLVLPKLKFCCCCWGAPKPNVPS